MKVKKRPLVYIEWEDHSGYCDGWINFEKVDNKPCLIKSVGWIIYENKKYVSLSACIDTQGGGKSGKNISTIIKKCIVKRKTFG